MAKFEDRHRLVPAVYLLLRKEDEILLLRRFNTGYHDGEYSLPAGHLDGGESAAQAMIREVQEEVGIDLRPEQLKLVHTMHRQSTDPELHERLDLFFEATEWTGTPANMEPNKCDELRWSSLSDLPDNVVPEVALVLSKIVAKDNYSDLNFD